MQIEEKIHSTHDNTLYILQVYLDIMLSNLETVQCNLETVQKCNLETVQKCNLETVQSNLESVQSNN